MTKRLQDKCPACGKPLAVERSEEGNFSVWCGYGPCPSTVSNEGGEDVSITGAILNLEAKIDAE
jgi:ssDNA-binding Zn-finger/Zn-ribbon topoisomerase 1